MCCGSRAAIHGGAAAATVSGTRVFSGNIFLKVILFALIAFRVVNSQTTTTPAERTTLKYTTTEISPRSITNDKPLFCKSEPFKNGTLRWNQAEVGTAAITNIPCLQRNGLPLTRKCQLDSFSQPLWEDISTKSIDCLELTRQKLITKVLMNLERLAFVENSTAPAEAVRLLKRNLRAKNIKLIPTDIHFACRIVKQAVERAKSADLCLTLLGMYNGLMGVDREVLRASTVFNSTNKLVASFESCVDGTYRERSSARWEERVEMLELAELGVRAHLAQNLSVFLIDPNVANVSGIALYDQPLSDGAGSKMFREEFGDFYYRFLYSNESVTNLLKDKGLQVARNLTQDLSHPGFVIIKVYSSDVLFLQPSLRTDRKVFSKIASVTIPGVRGSFDGFLPVIFRNTGPSVSHPETGCGYWNYETWLSDGIVVLEKRGDLVACGTHHMTQFSYLIGGDYRFADFSESVVITKLHLRALDIITLIGCTLSVIGLLGIFITSILFKSWRSKASSKVLLHLCTAMICQMAIFCFVNTNDMTEQLVEDRDYIGCVAVGALLQYFVLVQFIWMLLIAFFQFQRYVQVFGSKPKHFVLKSAIIGWGVPIIPPAILIAVDRSSYIPDFENDKSLMCYPSGHGLHLGVVLPVTLIIMANFIIFVMVFWNISHTMESSSSKVNEKKKILRQIRLLIMMFFLFGFSWIFGLLAAMEAGLVFSYLFCLTATLEGFVLFVYFVLLDPTTRKLWSELFGKDKDKLRESETVKLRSGTNTTSG
ncbi:LOW QUALITY PROTEIN: adhesion G-protein coupled receptor G2-like [Eupeodes corollae]|uniref:LOW QUALITY PROTEIN: adhesion G-protein coupled receptor G2-like n=1 Tax=Eupeodes corollae TaxID=290404 RepID=UPI002491FF86|nr:LOW QUALITY PROTEIN: adhesion G-protein coupled receptor G2-like [Eupeodes corollae]